MAEIDLIWRFVSTLKFEEKTCSRSKKDFWPFSSWKNRVLVVKVESVSERSILGTKIEIPRSWISWKNCYGNARIDPYLWRIDPWRNIFQRFFFFQGLILDKWRIDPCVSGSKIVLSAPKDWSLKIKWTILTPETTILWVWKAIFHMLILFDSNWSFLWSLSLKWSNLARSLYIRFLIRVEWIFYS